MSFRTACYAWMSAAITICAGTPGPTDLAGKPIDPLASAAPAQVFVFVRTDCPISNRYAPELQRLAAEFADRGVKFWLVYPDAAESPAAIKNHIAEFRFPGTPVRDLRHTLVA